MPTTVQIQHTHVTKQCPTSSGSCSYFSNSFRKMLQRETSGQDQVLHHQVCIIPDSFLLVVEFVEVLHVSEDDVFLVDDPWWDLLNATGHLPQIRLHREKLAKQRLINGGSFLPFLSQQLPHLHPCTPSGLARTPSLFESALP